MTRKIVSESCDEARGDAFAKVSATGEELGEEAGKRALEREYGISREQLDEIDANRKSSGSDCFDLIGRTSDGRWIVVEGKGPNAQLGKRQVENGDYVQQGSKEYFQSILNAMKIRGEDGLAKDLERALDNNVLEYLEVRAKVNTVDDDGNAIDAEYDGYEISKFKMPKT